MGKEQENKFWKVVSDIFDETQRPLNLRATQLPDGGGTIEVDSNGQKIIYQVSVNGDVQEVPPEVEES